MAKRNYTKCLVPTPVLSTYKMFIHGIKLAVWHRDVYMYYKGKIACLAECMDFPQILINKLNKLNSLTYYKRVEIDD